jgi:(p)ppGpp synthase/HD superfamily hydrolase
MGAGVLSEHFDQALAYAARHHRHQFRKGSNVPYLSHLMSVSALALELGGSENQAIAGLLHDAVEDAPTGEGAAVLADIRERFGEAVASMVEACSDSLNDGPGGKAPWEERKKKYVAELRDGSAKPAEAVLVTAADKIHNARCIADDLRTYGPVFWGTFNTCEHDLLWYYTAVEAAVAERLAGSVAAAQLHGTVDDLLEAAGADRSKVPTEPGECGCR